MLQIRVTAFGERKKDRQVSVVRNVTKTNPAHRQICHNPSCQEIIARHITIDWFESPPHKSSLPFFPKWKKKREKKNLLSWWSIGEIVSRISCTRNKKKTWNTIEVHHLSKQTNLFELYFFFVKTAMICLICHHNWSLGRRTPKYSKKMIAKMPKTGNEKH